jgi:hypothetical protein
LEPAKAFLSPITTLLYWDSSLLRLSNCFTTRSVLVFTLYGFSLGVP